VNRFGIGHTGEVDLEKVRKAQRQVAEASEDGASELYEWGCPVDKQWESDRFEAGEEKHQCKEDRDCICISRGAQESYLEMKSPVDVNHETVDANMNGVNKKIVVSVTPHYPLREMPEFEPTDINSDIGDVTERSPSDWMEAYKTNAPKMQHALDSLKKDIQDIGSKVVGMPFKCPGADEQGADEQAGQPDSIASMTKEEVHAASVKIRNFQVLQRDCERMRDTVPLLRTDDKLVEGNDASVFPDGGSPNRVNCYKLKNKKKLYPSWRLKKHATMAEDSGETPEDLDLSGDCVQLNCYTGHDDSKFRENLHEVEARMLQCEPEPEDTIPTAQAAATTGSTGTEAVTPDTAKGAGVGVAAITVLFARSPYSHASILKKKTWRTFL
jgi:hypothetical protein